MPEEGNNPAPAGNEGANNGGQPAGGNGNDPGKNGNEGEGNKAPDVDFSKLSDEQLAKVLEDPRTFNLPRIKELREKAAKAKEFEAAEAKKAEEVAIKKGEFDKVLADKDAKIAELQQQIQAGQLDNTLRGELQKAGVKNVEAALRLVDRSTVKIGENGQIEGLDKAVEGLKALSPEIFNSNTTSLGGGTNPPNPNPTGKFTLSQINDPQFYQKNYVAIQQAMAKGEIIDDLNK